MTDGRIRHQAGSASDRTDHALRCAAGAALCRACSWSEGIYVIGFFYPVVPKGQARIRVQISAAHERQHLDRAIEAFTKAGRELGVLKEAVQA